MANEKISSCIENNVLTITAEGMRLSIRAQDFSGDIRDHAVLHGLKQKLCDAAAIGRNPDTGRSATIADKVAAIHKVYTRLIAGQWNAESGGTGTGTGGLLFRALCQLYPAKTPEALRTFLAAKTPAEQAALRSNAKVAAIITRLRDEDALRRGADGDVSEDLLDELAASDNE